jgi:hypothetical protein
MSSPFTITVSVAATGNAAAVARALGAVLQRGVARLVAGSEKFLSQVISPQSSFLFEGQLQEGGRALLRALLECVLQHAEPAEPDPASAPSHTAEEQAPARIRTSNVDEYRRRPKSKLALATLFGEVTVYRFLYEALLPGELSRFPLDEWLGVEAGHVSPALAEKIARLAAEQTQGELLKTLQHEHGVKLSVERLRTVVSGVSQRMEPFVLPARVQRLVQWLKAAFSSRGKHGPTLAVGRDGCDLPMRGESYKVAATATVSVLDRRGKRLGTVYLGHMPEANQVSLSAELSALLEAVLRAWSGPLPRLAYIADGGYQETHYATTLRRMRHPVTQQPLAWLRIADFYHVCQYVHRLGVALFGEGREATRWFQKMRRLLRDQPRGAYRVLSSAAALASTRGPLLGQRREDYDACFRYLSKRLKYTDYFRYRRCGLPIGSGVTEAACKIVFTQRFKRSGMTWNRDSGQTVLLLRTLTLSGLWPAVFHASLTNARTPETLLKQRTNGPQTHVVPRNAA